MNQRRVKVIEAPEQSAFQKEASVFLAGGITNCPIWQTVVIESLSDLPIVFFNPRRTKWPEDERLLEEQVVWERAHLKKATFVAFWFPCETVCPITLLELGYALASGKPIMVGCHPNYSRRKDVVIQTRLTHPELLVGDSLEQLEADIRKSVEALRQCESTENHQ